MPLLAMLLADGVRRFGRADLSRRRPDVVLETAKGTIEFETYPEEAPKTVARILELVKKNFYNGQRFHRAEPKFVVQIGDPQTRNMQMKDWWGRSGFGKPIGVSEITKKRRHLRGAVAMGYAGTDPQQADSQFYIVLPNRARPRREVHRLRTGSSAAWRSPTRSARGTCSRKLQ